MSLQQRHAPGGPGKAQSLEVWQGRWGGMAWEMERMQPFQCDWFQHWPELLLQILEPSRSWKNVAEVI